MVVVIRQLQAEVGIGSAMVVTIALSLPSIGECHSEHVVYAIKCTSPIKLSANIISIAVRRIADILLTGLLVFTILGDATNHVRTVIVSPSW